ncbi:uncharacterized protein LOC135692274 [Rhopilema esculentum]|uniref:uncharacterized protein LOC135692274 n=1 Tax=Rhopilema esculentum TaxID=499914 RepID=UPI0031E2D6F2|eukprot:gene9461-17187_t
MDNLLKLLLATAVLLGTGNCNLQPPSTSEAKSEVKIKQQKTCEDGMQMVKTYLETSKIELIDNIRAAKQVQCKAQAWRKVDTSMVSHIHKDGVTLGMYSDPNGSLNINGKVTNYGCGKGNPSYSVIHIKGHWQQIMYTQVFKGDTSCWQIFGHKVPDSISNHKAGLEPFNPTRGDIIFGEKNMGSSTNNYFGGATGRCDNDADNFWHLKNGKGERQATVILRREKGADDAGIYTYTSCGKPEYTIKDIYVLE